MAKSIPKNNLPLTISKAPRDLTQEDIAALNRSAADIQPEFNPPASQDTLDIEVSEKINEIYKYLLDKKVTFFIAALLPKSEEPKAVYRLVDLNDPVARSNYHKLTAKLGWLLYCFLDHCKLTYWIASLGWIKVLKDVFSSNSGSK